MNIKVDGVQGVWRTIGGRRVFIKNGQNLQDAMRESGKFKKQNKVKPEDDSAYNDPRDEIMYYLKRGDFEKAEKYMKEYGLDDEKDMFIDGLRNETRQEYHNYLRTKNNKSFNTEDEAFIKDLTEHYDEFTRGDLQGTIEAKYGMGEKGQAILKEVDDRTYEKYKVDTLNNDDYLQANRPNEYFQKMLNENKYKIGDEVIYNGKRVRIAGIDHDAYGEDYLIEHLDNDFEGERKIYVGGAENFDKKDNTFKYTEYYKKENLGNPSNYQKGDKIEFDNGYNEKIKGTIIREATDKEKEFQMNKNLKGYIVKDINGNEHIVADTRIKNDNSQNSINNSLKQKAYQKYKKEHPNSKMTFEDFKNMNK